MEDPVICDVFLNVFEWLSGVLMVLVCVGLQVLTSPRQEGKMWTSGPWGMVGGTHL